ncbi:PTS beta-glucoside transporter subunit EIIBCA [Chlorella sorokiniana]|uniref:PTS beta-glucoside transporter subunit EIIBCA n=1 Tax=Chlorella sorokiniana TaxID=3076 RepID=A0A2P6U3G2_CHLSO|nr:PTS beta-glucoside transporter subunit EIIBCA [Chlorella sorokiniana]|eukprot:PRW60854.1 PTS beta-glucoside transporter subunit EIIBCA [Chlorella sorokiniana]
MVLCFGCNYCYLQTIGLVHGIWPFIVDTIWWVFWLALAAALSAVLDGFDDAHLHGGVSRPRVAIACAFSWFNWGLFTAAVVLDGIDHFGSRGITVTLPNPVIARMADGRVVQASTIGMGYRLEGMVAPAAADELVVVQLDGKA